MQQLRYVMMLLTLLLAACGSVSDTAAPAAGIGASGNQQNVLKSEAAQATTVRIQTVMGAIDIMLHDTDAPLTTANFLRYVTSGAYNSSFIHRSVPGFVIQGGGYLCDASRGCGQKITSNAPVANEFSASRSNLRGTIAMAKLSGDPNSATNEWFINLADNSANLDNQNGGFTVFGKVIGGGMSVVDAIAALQVVNAGGAFSTLPLVSLPSTGTITQSHLVMVQSISVTQSIPVAVSLTASPRSPQPAGTVVTFTAAGSGGAGSYEYQYWASVDGGATWSPIHGAYSASNTSVTANTTGIPAGTYLIGVIIKTAGSIPANGLFDSYAILPYTVS